MNAAAKVRLDGTSEDSVHIAARHLYSRPMAPRLAAAAVDARTVRRRR